MTRKILGRIAVVVLVVLGLFIFSNILQASGNSGVAFERVKSVQEEHTKNLMANKGVVGTAIGLEGSNGHVMMVLVEHQRVRGIPGKLDGVPVRPVVTGKIYASPKGGNGGGGGGGGGKPEPSIDPTARFEAPIPIGVSTGHPDITAGTIGCRVTDVDTNVYALSNNHVYANENKASIGDSVIQPGTFDGGVSHRDDIGTLAAFKPISFTGDNLFDAAIAIITPQGLLDNATPSDGYGTPKSTTATPVLNASVKKYGRTTGFTKGKIYATNATVNVQYDSGVATFVNQIIITPGSFSAGGDSGSLVVIDASKGRNKADDRKPVGLLFAGSSQYTIASPIQPVLDRFGVTIDGE